MATRLPALLLALALATACSSGGDGDDDGASLGDTAPPTEVTAPAPPETPPAGTGVVVIGGTTSDFSVTECELEPAGAGAPLVHVTGAGTSATGIPFQLEMQRVAAETAAAETFTDTVTYSDTARILQLQRFEVGGEVSDLRDPDARSSLLRVRADGVSAVGLAGPPGTGGDFMEGIVGMAVDATCS